jgi:hypothetical protein
MPSAGTDPVTPASTLAPSATPTIKEAAVTDIRITVNDQTFTAQLADNPTARDLIDQAEVESLRKHGAVGDLSSAIGDAAAADQYYQMAEQIERAAWGNGLKQPQVLARILSERPGRAAEAVALAEEAARRRADIMTMDTLA